MDSDRIDSIASGSAGETGHAVTPWNTLMRRRPGMEWLLVLAAGLLLAGAATAGAKVRSVEIDRPSYSGDTPYLSRQFGGVVAKPLVMESRKGNPTVTYRIYLAPGEQSDHGAFTFFSSYTWKFEHFEISGGKPIGWRLDTSTAHLPLGAGLKTLPSGIYSVYITADDGEGECPPSGIVQFELMPHPEQVFLPPVISEIRSPAAGIVVMRVKPVTYTGKGSPDWGFALYRADGVSTDRAAFRPIIGAFRAPVYLVDTARQSSQKEAEIVIAGLKSGETSFLLEIKLERGEWGGGIAGNITTVKVAGTSPADDNPRPYINFLESSGVGWEVPSHEEIALYPNPASEVLHMRWSIQGEATVRIYNAIGEEVGTHQVNLESGSAPLDISGLPAGRYIAVAHRRARSGNESVKDESPNNGSIGRATFTVVR